MHCIHGIVGAIAALLPLSYLTRNESNRLDSTRLNFHVRTWNGVSYRSNEKAERISTSVISPDEVTQSTRYTVCTQHTSTAPTTITHATDGSNVFSMLFSYTLLFSICVCYSLLSFYLHCSLFGNQTVLLHVFHLSTF